MEYASNAKGNAALTTGIIGTAGFGAQLLGNLLGMNGANCAHPICSENTGVNRFELGQETEIAALKSRNALLEANIYNDQKLLEVYKYFDGKIEGINQKLAEQAVWNATQIQAFLNDLTRKEALSPKTVKNTHGILHKALSQAMDLKYIPFNPADAVKLPRIEQKEIRPLTEEEISAFLAEIEESEPLARLFTVTLFTGMREGEICGLSWDAVNFTDGTITVKQQLQKGKEKGSSHYIATTKSSKARTITAAPYVMNLLKEQRTAQHRERLARRRAITPKRRNVLRMTTCATCLLSWQRLSSGISTDFTKKRKS